MLPETMFTRIIGKETNTEDKENNRSTPKTIHARVMDADSPGSPEHFITTAQQPYSDVLNSPRAYPNAKRTDTITGPFWKDKESDKLIVPPDDGARRRLMKIWHNSLTAGHPGRDETTRRILRDFHWPGARHWIADYIKGCATC